MDTIQRPSTGIKSRSTKAKASKIKEGGTVPGQMLRATFEEQASPCRTRSGPNSRAEQERRFYASDQETNLLRKKEILSDGYKRMPSKLLRTNLPATAKLVLMCLFDYVWEGPRARHPGLCCPAQMTIATMCGISQRTVSSAIALAERMGILYRDRNAAWNRSDRIYFRALKSWKVRGMTRRATK